MNIGKNVKKLRIQKGLTQSELAQVVGVVASMIGHIEKGLKIPSLAVALEMAKFFGCSVEEMCEEESECRTA